MNAPSGHFEELELERLAVAAFELEADKAWKARAYTWARLMKQRADAARARVLELETRSS